MIYALDCFQNQFGSTLDFWNFVQGLRWLDPVMSPSIEQLRRLGRGSLEVTAGQAWVRQSLLGHNLSTQLQTLVGNKAHLRQHYEGRC